MRTSNIALTTSIKATSTIVPFRFINFAGTYCDANAKALGVSQDSCKTDEMCPIAVYGIVSVEAGGAITAGAKVTSDENGKAVALTTGELNGYALDAATAAGQYIRIKLV